MGRGKQRNLASHKKKGRARTKVLGPSLSIHLKVALPSENTGGKSDGAGKTSIRAGNNPTPRGRVSQFRTNRQKQWKRSRPTSYLVRRGKKERGGLGVQGGLQDQDELESAGCTNYHDGLQGWRGNVASSFQA